MYTTYTNAKAFKKTCTVIRIYLCAHAEDYETTIIIMKKYKTQIKARNQTEVLAKQKCKLASSIYMPHLMLLLDRVKRFNSSFIKSAKSQKENKKMCYAFEFINTPETQLQSIANQKGTQDKCDKYSLISQNGNMWVVVTESVNASSPNMLFFR